MDHPPVRQINQEDVSPQFPCHAATENTQITEAIKYPKHASLFGRSSKFLDEV